MDEHDTAASSEPSSSSRETYREQVFRYRGALLALPALALVAFGRPSALSVTLGLPLAHLGELLRCWGVGYSGVTTRGDQVEAPRLATNGPYAYTRNPLYIGNAITALGFGIAFTGKLSPWVRVAMIAGGLTAMGAVYATIVPHEEAYLAGRFGESYRAYCAAVGRLVPRRRPYHEAEGRFDASVIARAETRTFVTFGLMLAALAWKASRETS